MRRFLAPLAVLVLASPLAAQEPSIGSLNPPALAPGQTVNLVTAGGNLAGAKQLWLSFPADAKLAEGIADNGTKADQTTWAVVVPPTTPVGIHGMRVLTDKGVAPLKFIVVDDLPVVASPGNNTTPANAFALTVPGSVSGAVGNQSVQYFKLTTVEGQRLSFEVLARRMGSSLDPMLRLIDPRGREVAFSDDAPGLSGDSQFEYVFKTAGDYLLELRDIRYQGGAYHLRVGDFPCATTPYPLAIQRGTTANIGLAGAFVDGVAPVAVAAPADPTLAWLSVSAKRQGGLSSGFGQLQVVDRPQFVETEPNNKPEEANRFDPTHDLNGRLDTPGDVDRFVFTGKKDQTVIYTGITRQQGSPTDLNIKLMNKDGGQIAAVDDTGTNEGILTAKLPADGDYTLVVEDLSKRGGPNYSYRIAISEAAQPFTLAVSGDTANVPAGGTISWTVTAVRNGYTGPIELSVAPLPPGLTASPSIIGPARNDAVLTLTAGPEFVPATLHTLRVLGTAKIGDANVAVAADFAGVLKQRNGNMRFPPATLDETIAAAAAPATGFTWKLDPPTVVFGKELSAKVKLLATRGEGIDEAITIAQLPPQNGLPPGITAALKNIDKGANEVELVISANKDAPLGEFTVAVLGTHKKGNVTLTQPAAVRIKLEAPLTVALDVGGAKLARGGVLIVKARVTRNPALTGPVVIALQNLPAGVTAAEATIPAEASEIELKLTAAADAAQGAADKLAAKGTATVGNSKFEAVSTNATITVE